MNDIWAMTKKNFMELGKLLANLCKSHKEKPSNATSAVDSAKQSYSQSVVDLNSPPYAAAVLHDINYTPT